MKNFFNYRTYTIPFSLVLLVGIFATLTPSSVFAALPAGFETETLASGINTPTQMAFAPDGRIFIAQKDGTVVVWKNGALLPTPVIELTDVNSYGDRGLLGIAVDPQFGANNYMYLLYTRENTPGTNFAGKKTGRIVRVTLVGDTADESTKTVLVGSVGGTLALPSCADYATTSDCIPSDSASHSVGGLRFGPDGKLYATLGEGANFDYADPLAMRAQSLDSLGGKMLRINTDGTAPSDNPFFDGNVNSNRSKIYAYGLRNDFRFNFRNSTGSLFSGDVGWSSWEEVNKIVAGGNYGWPCYEGNEKRAEFNCTVVGMKGPLYTYAHDVNGAGSVTAGAFGSSYPAPYQNSLFIGDYAQNWIKRVVLDGSENYLSTQDFMSAADGSNGPVDITEGPDGNVYYLAIYTGELKRILYTTGNRQPIAVLTASSTSGALPLSVSFTGSTSSDPDGNPLAYLWNFGDGATSTSANPVHIYSTQGNYTAALTVFDGQGGQNTKSITIYAGNRAPTATIISPPTGGLYKVGDIIALNGSAVDPEDGILSGTSLVWTIILHHNTHTHTLQTLTGTSPSFPAPDHNDTDVYTEVKLTVTDSGGLSTSKSVNLYLDNFVPTLGNQILNPSLETPAPASATSPEHWAIGGYGINVGTYTYPVAGFDGTDAAQVTVTSYTDGDAKWSHEPITVSAGHSYDFSGYYKSSAAVGIIVQIGYGDGTYTYANLGDIPVAANWTRVDKTYVIPAGGTTMVVSFPLTSVGQMTIDLFSIQSTPLPGDVTPPTAQMVSPLTSQTVSGITTLIATAADAAGVSGLQYYVDGVAVGNQIAESPYAYAWNTQSVANGTHTILAVAKDTSNNKGSSTPITLTVLNQTAGGGATTTNSILNPSVETAGTAGKPQSWAQGKYGTNNATFSYPVLGYDGAKAIQINATTFANGAARWYFNDVPVVPGSTLQFSDFYKSTATSTMMFRYTLTSGAFGYVNMGNLPAAANWTKAQYNFVVPAGASSMSVFHSLYNIGSLTTDMYSLGPVGVATDTTPPVVAISTPVAGATVSGNTAVRAQAGDLGGIAGVKFYIDNIQQGSEVLLSPYERSLDTTLYSNGSYTLFAVARDTTGNIATSTSVAFTVNNSGGGGGDTTAPSVTITSPATGATVSGNVTIVGNSSDNIGVTALQLKIDNILVASGITPAFSFVWNSASTTNGSHSASVTASDLAGNNSSSTITLNVQNAVATTTMGPNLIPNGNLETANGASPLGWNRGGWGTNNRIFTYPIVGQDGQKGARVAMTTYANGDAKWYFNKIAITPGTQYNFSGWYKTGTILDVIGEYTMSNGSLLYVGIAKENQPTTTWAKMSSNFTPPAGAVSLTLFPLISAVGTLDIDDFSINVIGTTTVNTDSQAPLVAMTSPLNNATVSGTVNISASSTDNVGVTKLWFAVDGNVVSPTYTSAPYIYALNTTLLTNGVHLLKATAEDAVGNNNTGTSTIIVSNSTSTPDIFPPVISITNPTSGGTVSGNVTITASSSDNIGVVGVKFFVDAVQLGIEDLTAPYSTAWSTVITSNGSHTITTVARDAAGNTSTATSTVTVNNVVATTTNLIANPSVETAGVGGLPLNWFKGGWGTNNAVLSYPVAGQDGASAVQVVITSYTDGDGKWYFAPKAVTAGTPYIFTDYYKSNATSTITAWYTLSDGTSRYIEIGSVPPSAGWSQFSALITPPASTTQMTVFHQLRSVGTLATDNYSLAPSNGQDPNAFSQGMVSLTFDDGWLSHFVNAAPVLDIAGMKGSFEIITSYSLNALANPISNSSFEATGTAGLPLNWFKGGWGTNNAVLSWPVQGITGNNAAQVQITTYTDGDAKWFFNDVSVVDGLTYSYTDRYKSDVTSSIVARYYMGSSTYIYQQLASIAPSASWATATAAFTVPADVQSVTIFHSIASIGTLTFDDAVLKSPQSFVSPSQILTMQANGHEIGAHTQTHVSLSTVPTLQMQSQIVGSRNDLLAMGVTNPDVLVYPYGDYSLAVKQTAQTSGFIAGRSVDRGYNTKITDKYALKVQQVDLTTTPAQIQAWVDNAKLNNNWLILMFHQVDSSGAQLSITPANFQTVVDNIKASGISVVTMKQGVAQMAP